MLHISKVLTCLLWFSEKHDVLELYSNGYFTAPGSLSISLWLSSLVCMGILPNARSYNIILKAILNFTGNQETSIKPLGYWRLMNVLQLLVAFHEEFIVVYCSVCKEGAWNKNSESSLDYKTQWENPQSFNTYHIFKNFDRLFSLQGSIIL